MDRSGGKQKAVGTKFDRQETKRYDNLKGKSVRNSLESASQEDFSVLTPVPGPSPVKSAPATSTAKLSSEDLTNAEDNDVQHRGGRVLKPREESIKDLDPYTSPMEGEIEKMMCAPVVAVCDGRFTDLLPDADAIASPKVLQPTKHSFNLAELTESPQPRVQDLVVEFELESDITKAYYAERTFALPEDVVYKLLDSPVAPAPIEESDTSLHELAGDGTTCATVLTRAIFTEGCKSVAPGMNAMDLRRGITMAVDAVLTNLKSRARMIRTSEEIAQVGTISANGETEIGELIAKAMEKVGKEGFITIQDGKTLYNELEVVAGMKLDSGYISPYFITNQKNQKCDLDDPLILIHEKKISSGNAMVKVLELALKRQRPLLIVAEDVESDALATLILNKLHAGIKVCAIKAPGLGENRKSNLQDLAVLTGGQVITEELGMNLDDVELDMLGSCKKVTISKDDTVVLDGAGERKAIEERCEQIRSSVELSTSDYDKEKLQERLAMLSGGVAVLKIGGASESEVGAKKDRVTDALNATKAAVEEGIVPGGGVALLYASIELDKLPTANFDQKIGVQIIQNALKAPVYTVAMNAGVEGAVIVGKLLESDNPDLGYDAAKGEYVNMMEAGIIDPLKVIRTALVDAASVSSLMTTTEAIVVDLPSDEKAAPGMGGGGMGVMDY